MTQPRGLFASYRASRLNAKGDRLWGAGRFDEAARAFEAAGNPREAAKAWEKAGTAEAQHHAVRCWLEVDDWFRAGVLLEGLGRYQEAADCFEKDPTTLDERRVIRLLMQARAEIAGPLAGALTKQIVTKAQALGDDALLAQALGLPAVPLEVPPKPWRAAQDPGQATHSPSRPQPVKPQRSTPMRPAQGANAVADDPQESAPTEVVRVAGPASDPFQVGPPAPEATSEPPPPSAPARPVAAAPMMSIGTRPPLGPGATLGRYVLGPQLGRGGMGVVWRARDTVLDRDVALKFVLGGSEAVQAERFSNYLRREGRTAARLQHPSIVTVFDMGELEGHLYLAMEFIPGRSLKAVLEEGVLPLARGCRLLAQAAEAILHAHQEGVVHRDIKPANLMVTDQDRVKVMDFGLAALDATGGVHTTVSAGSPAYMAPEQVEGRADARTDVFSFGITAYSVVAGRRPTEGRTPVWMARRIAPPNEVRPEVPVDLAIAVMSCMQLHPEDRPGGLGPLRDALVQAAGQS